jgi:hypothetical protein
MRSRLALAAALGLACCAGDGGLPLGPTVGVPAPAGAAVQGQADIVVRAFVADPEGAPREVGGAVCDVRSVLFEARLVTPARLVFPSYGPQSPTLAFDCRAGALAGEATRGVVTRWVRAPGAWPGPGPWGWPYGGAWGGPWGWGGWGWDAPSFPIFVYPDVDVPLRSGESLEGHWGG